MATILLSMLARKGHYITPEDVANAVLTEGATATRAELVRLMARAWDEGPMPDGTMMRDPYPYSWIECAWTLEETARTAGER